MAKRPERRPTSASLSATASSGRFTQALKEQCLYLHQVASLDDARRVIGAVVHHYSTEWLTARLGHRTPTGARATAWAEAA